MAIKGEFVKFKNYERKLESPFMIYAEFESILVPKNNGKSNLNESNTYKYKKHVACSCGYKLVCADDKFSKPFKHTKEKMQFTISSIVWLKKVYNVMKWWKNSLTKNL